MNSRKPTFDPVEAHFSHFWDKTFFNKIPALSRTIS